MKKVYVKSSDGLILRFIISVILFINFPPFLRCSLAILTNGRKRFVPNDGKRWSHVRFKLAYHHVQGPRSVALHAGLQVHSRLYDSPVPQCIYPRPMGPSYGHLDRSAGRTLRHGRHLLPRVSMFSNHRHLFITTMSFIGWSLIVSVNVSLWRYA